MQLFDQTATDRVHRFGAIQGDQNPFALLLVKNFLIVVHEIPLNPPLPKGEFLLWPRSQRFPSLEKRGKGRFPQSRVAPYPLKYSGQILENILVGKSQNC